MFKWIKTKLFGPKPDIIPPKPKYIHRTASRAVLMEPGPFVKPQTAELRAIREERNAQKRQRRVARRKEKQLRDAERRFKKETATAP